MAPPQPPSNEYPDPAAFFQQIINSLGANRPGAAASRGVDQSDAAPGGNNAAEPTFWPGFPFGRPPPPPGPGGPGHHGPHPAPPPPPPPPAPPGDGRHPHPPPPPPGGWGWAGGPGRGWYMDDGYPWFNDDEDDRRRGHGHHGRGGGRHGRHGRRRRGGDDSDEDGTRENPAAVSDDENKKTETKKMNDEMGDEKSGGSPDTMRQEAVPDPDEMVPEYDEANDSNENNNRGGPAFYGGFGGFGGHGWGRRGHHHHARGGCGGRGGFGRRHHHHQDRRGGGPCPRDAFGGGDFDWPGMMRGIMGHPFIQHMTDAARSYNNNNNAADNDNDNDGVDTFTPPADIFDTPRAYVLHVALPGARREDVGVNWDPERSTLSVAGVVHRPGDEEFLKTMISSERRTGVFEKKIVLPPSTQGQQQQTREEVDAEGIAAKLDEGVLVILVPKMEKEWTEVRKVDIL